MRTVTSSDWDAGYEDGFHAREAEESRGKEYMAGYMSGEADLTEFILTHEV